MDSPLKVLFVSSESRPFASTGGLADVSEALPNELNRAGVRVERILPLYRRVVEGQGLYRLERTPHTLMIPLGSDVVPAEIYATEHQGTRTYFVGREEYFDRSELYALPHREYSDNFERFLFFQKAVVALIDGLGKPYHLVHLNDWQTGLIPSFLERGIAGTGRVRTEATLFTIHNLAYQGIYPASRFYETNLPGGFGAHAELEFYNQINCMKAGLLKADRVNTVSRTYAEEIQTPQFGCGLQGVLQSLRAPVSGIVNGVDYATWDPAHDPVLVENYGPKALAGKESCKKALVNEFGLEYHKDIPVYTTITRLVDQKGLDVLAAAMEHLMAQRLQFVLLGSGQAEYQEMVTEWQKRWPKQFAVKIGYDVALSHQMEAGADFFLMPSRFEPCGLNQLYSLKYGTVPIVNGVGGLVDTVTDLRAEPEHGTGYVMHAYTPEALLEAVRGSLSLFHEPARLRKVRRNGMAKDFSWARTAVEYRALYESLCAK